MDRKTVTSVLLVALIAAALVAGWLVSPWSPFRSEQADGITTTTAPRDPAMWSSGRPVTHQPYLAPGGLAHPSSAGQGRSGLIAWGWEWIASPPGEAEVGLDRAG